MKLRSAASNYVSSNPNGKGKQVARDEGQGGTDGIVLELQQVGDTAFDISYSIPVLVGTSSQQNISLQVDTGSSDLWLASSSCSTSSCSGAKGYLYDSSSSTSTGKDFDITYLSGSVSGPIVWDQVQIGGYSITNQALAAASTVDGEPLASDFSGILGLALPRNSIIAQDIPPVTSNNPDGAAFSSNLFGITPVEQAPASRFISLSLSRPGSDRVPALLGIGRHPSELVSDPKAISYSTLVGQSSGTLFWKSDIRAITVYDNGVAKNVTLGMSTTGNVFPTAVLDTGVPTIVTTSNIANGIYGALGISPAQDGNYYIECDVPLNMTITLDGHPPIPLHPLDLTTASSADPSSRYCVGLIQSLDSALKRPGSDIGDMILGVPFMRNVYTVMAYEPPDADGNFETNGSAAPSIDNISPRLGLLGLTDPTTALDEFHKVRVLNQPLSPSSQTTPTSSTKGMSVGIKILIGLVSFFAFCVFLFFLRWIIARRQWRRRPPFEGDQKDGYALAPRGASYDGPSEDTLRALRFEAYKKERMHSEYTVSSGQTQIEHQSDDSVEDAATISYPPKSRDSPASPIDITHDGDWRDTLVGDQRDDKLVTEDGLLVQHPPHVRSLSEVSDIAVAVPLLAHTRSDSRQDDVAGVRDSMVGVGTASRSARLDADRRHPSVSSVASERLRPVRSPSGPRPPSNLIKTGDFTTDPTLGHPSPS
ncbi:hypothetical protein PLICRDRAFT_536119 [Plicaturopsis crispa FD-325 SS-3]|nr:hypothetical protein PLICRDRAFT_536119 [Plicaturopsis crispa FD-325 SS-3]